MIIWYRNSILASIISILGCGSIIAGVGDNTFEPQRSITRAEVAKVIYSVMKEVAAQ